MKFLILSFVLLSSISSFAGSPFAIVKCNSETVFLEAFTEGCQADFKLLDGEKLSHLNQTCENTNPDVFNFEINMEGEKNPLQLMAVLDTNTYMLLGYDVQAQNSESKPTDVKRYLMKADLYHLSGDSTASAAHKGMSCEVETFLMNE